MEYESPSDNYVFTRRKDGELEFKGDFEGLYQVDPDPWGQSGEHPRMKEYYAFSRSRLLHTLEPEKLLSRFDWTSLLEVGCGTGHVVNHLQGRFPGRVIHGCDISPTAIRRAYSLFPHGSFFVRDVADPLLALNKPLPYDNYDVVVLSQILWYVLDRLPTVFDNCWRMLRSRGHLVIQTAFLERQEYGREIINGWHGLFHWVLSSASGWRIVSASYDATGQYAPYHDGILVLRNG